MSSVWPVSTKMQFYQALTLLSISVVFAQGSVVWRNKEVRGPSLRITGGEEVEPHELSYQAGLFITQRIGVVFCGGSLISQTTILTAAHCVDGAKSIEVVLGAHKIRENEPTQIRANTTNYLVHPKWSILTVMNDLAIVFLPEPVELSENIGVISLPSKTDVDNTFEGTPVIASGWGMDSDATYTISEVLRKVEAPVNNNFVCKLFYFGSFHDSQLCTSGVGGKSTCSGDSGGPLVAQNKLIGITSFGVSFGCEVGWPAAFTRVTSYLDWIAENSDGIVD